MRLTRINGAQRISRNPASKPKYQRRMLEALASGLSPARAAKAAGVGRSTAYLWRRQDPEFARKWDEAVVEGIDLLEEEARRRAVDGFNERPVYHRGVIVGEIREYSDKLLMFLLKRRMPEVYGKDANRPRGFARSHDASRKVDTKEEEVRERIKRLGLEAYVDAPREPETPPETTEKPEPKR
jgi:hypothetical protein